MNWYRLLCLTLMIASGVFVVYLLSITVDIVKLIGEVL
jgi:hypothetical protein